MNPFMESTLDRKQPPPGIVSKPFQPSLTTMHLAIQTDSTRILTLGGMGRV